MPIQYVAPLKKLCLFAMEIKVALWAQFNPKEISIEKSVTWNASPSDKGDMPDYEFSSGAARTLSLELLFDTYETGDGGQPDDVSTTHVAMLMQLMMVMDLTGDEDRKRPPIIQVRWDDTSFEGVLQSVSTKYTMFAPSGRPVRATCAIKVLEVKRRFEGKCDDQLHRPKPRDHRGW